MKPRPSFDRILLLAIITGVVSIVGVVWVLSTSDLDQAFIPATALPSTFSPVRTGTADLSRSATSDPAGVSPTVTRVDPDIYPETPTEMLPPPSTLTPESLPTPSATYTPDQGESLRAGKFDDTDPNIAYDPSWTALKNPGTVNAYKGTIHASSDIGSEASFRFTGTRFFLGYQRGKNFGIVTVIIDDQQYGFHEQAFDLVWKSPQLSPGNHFVRIIHDSGESINLDYIVVLD